MKKVIVANYRYYVSGGPEVYMFKFMDKSEDIGYYSIPFSVKYSKNHDSIYSEYFIDSRGGDSVYYDEIKKTPKALYRTIQGAFNNKQASKNLIRLIKKEKPEVLYALQVINTLSPSIFKTAKKRGLRVVHRISDFNILCPKSDFLRNEEVCNLCINGKFRNGIKNKCYHNSKIASIIRCMSMYYHRMKKYYKYVDYFVTPTNFTRNKFIEAGFSPEKVVVVPTFIDSKKIAPNYDNYNYLLFLGRIVPEKGLKYAIEALKYLKNDYNIKLKVTGNKESCDEEILKLINDYSLDDNIEFVGFVRGGELENLISNSSIVLCPAIWYENMPNTIIEAFAYGKPVIASRLGCFSEIIEDGKDGLLFEPKNSKDLSDKIRIFLDDKNNYRLFGKNGRKKVETIYNPENHFRILKRLFDN